MTARSIMVEGKYHLFEKIGEGSFGSIFSGKNKNTEEGVAVKLEKTEQKGLLKHEAHMYNFLAGIKGIPSLRSFGIEGKFSYLVLDLLDYSLKKVLEEYSESKFKLKTVLYIGIQMLKRLEDIHKKGIIHRDIKPDNLMICKHDNFNTIYLIDFGLAKMFIDDKGKHIPMEKGKNMTGTAKYVSLNVHKGYSQSRRDDLESLGYVLIYFLQGESVSVSVSEASKSVREANVSEANVSEASESEANVSVSEANESVSEANVSEASESVSEASESVSEANESVSEANVSVSEASENTCMKKKINLCDNLKDIPGEFIIFINYCRNLKYEEDPDYTYLKMLFLNLYKHHGFEMSKAFDYIFL
jgi:serine/threonine protein kinase